MNKALHVCVAALLATSLSIANAAPETGWYWNPAESGRGFFVESNNGVTFIGAYLYDADGHAQWLVSGAPNADPYNYTGDLFSMRNGQTLLGGYVRPQGPEKVGRLSVHFSDDTHGTVTWSGGTVAIERHIFGGKDAIFQPAPGWWWDPSEDGSGYSIEVQGDKLFLVGFMYDTSGRPVWYFSAGPMNSPTRYSGTLLQFANGQTLGGPYRPPSTPATVGKVDIDFIAWDLATLTFSGARALAARSAIAGVQPSEGGASRSVSARPMFTKDNPVPVDGYPLRYTGKFHVEQRITVSGTSLTWTLDGDSIWLRYDCREPNWAACYFAASGEVGVKFTTRTLTEAIDCKGGGETEFPILHPESTKLLVDKTSGFAFAAILNSPPRIEFSTKCTIAGVTATVPGTETFSWYHPWGSEGLEIQNQVIEPTYDGKIRRKVDKSGGFWESWGPAPNAQGRTEEGWASFAPL